MTPLVIERHAPSGRRPNHNGTKTRCDSGFTNGTVTTTCRRTTSVFVLGICLLFHTCVGVKSFDNGIPSQRREQLLPRRTSNLVLYPPIHAANDPSSSSSSQRRRINVIDRIRSYRGGNSDSFSSNPFSSPSQSSSAIDSMPSNSNDEIHGDQEASIGNITSTSLNAVSAASAAYMEEQQQSSSSGILSTLSKLVPRIDEEEMKLLKISLPVIANFAINPLIGAVDLFWVNRMGNALAVAGQAAANQVFSSSFWFISFLPSVTATLVSKKHAEGDVDATQDAICQALLVGFAISVVGTLLMLYNPVTALSAVLKSDAPALTYARPYLLVRAFSFVPSIISVVGFSAFRGKYRMITISILNT